MSRRHANEVDKAITVHVSSAHEDVYRLVHPQNLAALEVEVRGLNRVMNTSLLQNGAKDAVHQAMAELKAGRVDVDVAYECVVTKCAHQYAASRAYGICREHLHAQAVPQEFFIMVPIECLLQPGDGNV